MYNKKFHWYFIFSIVELIFLLLFSIHIMLKGDFLYDFHDYGTDRSDGMVKICTERIAVPKGIYQITVYYEKKRGNGQCYAQASEKGVHSLYSDHVKLSYLQSERSFDIYVNDAVDDLRLVVEPEENGSFVISRIHMETAANAKAYQILHGA